MSRRQWKDLAEAIGFMAIIASLVFVGIETRNSTKQSELNTQALEIAAYQALMSNIDSVNALSLESPTAASTMARIWDGEALDQEQFQLNRMLYILFRHGDLAYFMYERGAIDEERLRSALAPVPIDSEVGRTFWEARKGSFTLNYRAYVDQMIADRFSLAPDGIDHLLYASSDLERGMDEIESLLGVRPVRGGHHPQYGTHNALLSLGPGMYLEVIARDPQLATPPPGALVDISPDARSRLVTWVYRAANIEASAAAASDAALGLGRVESGSRTRPDGSVIRWQLTDPYAMPLNGAIPFLITWGDTTHPSTVVPSGGQLVELIIEHPEPDRVRSALAVLGAEVSVIEGDEFRLSARIQTMDGLVILE